MFYLIKQLLNKTSKNILKLIIKLTSLDWLVVEAETSLIGFGLFSTALPFLSFNNFESTDKLSATIGIIEYSQLVKATLAEDSVFDGSHEDDEDEE